MNCGHLWITKATSTLVWLALDADSREIVGVTIGARNETAARQLWNSLPAVYRQCAIRAPRVIPPAYRATPIFGKHTQPFYRASGIKQWGKRLAKLVILNDLIIPYGNEFLD